MRKYKKAFTLIELLIVIALVGILATITVLQFVKYRSRAGNASALSALRTAMMAEELYASRNGEFLYVRTRGFWAPTGDVKLWDRHRRVVDVLHLPAKVYLYIKTNRRYYTTYTAVTKHRYGDSYFGAEPDAQGYFYDKKTKYIGKRLLRRDCPRPHPDRIDFVPRGRHHWKKF